MLPTSFMHGPHYILFYAFMHRDTLHAHPFIHAQTYITCEKVHSCFFLHYMHSKPFMREGTFYVGHTPSFIEEPSLITFQNTKQLGVL